MRAAVPELSVQAYAFLSKISAIGDNTIRKSPTQSEIVGICRLSMRAKPLLTESRNAGRGRHCLPLPAIGTRARTCWPTVSLGGFGHSFGSGDVARLVKARGHVREKRQAGANVPRPAGLLATVDPSPCQLKTPPLLAAVGVCRAPRCRCSLGQDDHFDGLGAPGLSGGAGHVRGDAR